jgi:glyoxylase-like metal-dependent hydrolase (beta-lactamase superfamily II)
MIDVRMFTVGPLQENCFVVRRKDANAAVMADPGEEAARLLRALESLNVETLAAILLTHTHFDHIGAVAAVARATNAPVYCPKLEKQILADPNRYIPTQMFGTFEGYDADFTVSGGEVLELAGLTIDVLFTPGHSPGHVTYAIRDEDALLSGDVLFQGSVGRTDLPGGDWPTLLTSIDSLISGYRAETTVYPGHMGVTTLGRERATNPFLRELA